MGDALPLGLPPANIANGLHCLASPVPDLKKPAVDTIRLNLRVSSTSRCSGGENDSYVIDGFHRLAAGLGGEGNPDQSPCDAQAARHGWEELLQAPRAVLAAVNGGLPGAVTKIAVLRCRTTGAARITIGSIDGEWNLGCAGLLGPQISDTSGSTEAMTKPCPQLGEDATSPVHDRSG